MIALRLSKTNGMDRFRTLTVAEIRQETEDCVSVLLGVPDDLREEFRFISGQYITFKKEIGGEELRRSYSICTATYENELRVGIKRLPDGRFSSFANEVLKVGDTLETMPPTGRFLFNADEKKTRHLVGIAGGSGITPVLSIIKDVLNSEPQSRFTLFYGNRNSASVIFREQLAALKNRYMDRLSINHVLSDEEVAFDLFHGMMDSQKVKELCDRLIDVKTVDSFYICGPEPMIIGARDVLAQAGVSEEKVHFELFGTAAGPRPEVAGSKEDERGSGPIKSRVSVIMDGDEFEFGLSSNGETILEAATNAGIDVPFSCKGAVCCTCLARVKNGEVKMDKNYSLSEKEVEQGLVLTCQGHPRSARVTVDYDDIW